MEILRLSLTPFCNNHAGLKITTMLIQRAYKAELSPSQDQRLDFARHCGTARFAFNYALGRKIEHYKTTGKTLSYAAIDADFNAKKKTEFQWAYESSKCAHQNGIRDCEAAFANFFRGVKSGKKVGFPKFKSKHRCKAKYRVPGEAVTVEKYFIKLPKIGRVNFRRFGYVPTEGVKINSVTISECAGRWFASVQVEEEVAVTENQSDSIVGIDLGLKSFAVGSDGSRFESPRPLAKNLKKLRRLSRSLSRKKKGSNRRVKAKTRLAKLHFRIANQRADFIHKTSHFYASQYATVCVEDLHVAGMLRNRCLSRAISDSGWSEFSRQIAYKAVWRGGRVIDVDQWYPSSKLCSVCDKKRDKMPLSVRTWTCECGATHDRDENASKNIENYGTAVVNAETDRKRSAPGEMPLGVVEPGTFEVV